MPEALTLIGRTLRTHGVRGELKCSIDEAFWDDFESLDAVFLPSKGVPTPHFVEGLRGSFPDVIVKFEGLATPEAARLFSHKEIFARTKDLRPAALATPEVADSYVFLTGFEASDLHAGPLGSIAEVQQWPSQEMAVFLQNDRETLVPLHPAFIVSIDKAQKTVVFNLPDGLLSL